MQKQTAACWTGPNMDMALLTRPLFPLLVPILTASDHRRLTPCTLTPIRRPFCTEHAALIFRKASKQIQQTSWPDAWTLGPVNQNLQNQFSPTANPALFAAETGRY
jgi:hypothetical protein